MCGIVGAIAERNVVPILMEGLRRLEYRGYDSAGIAVLNGTAHLKRLRTVGKVKMLQDAIDADPTHGKVGIAHTRWATHGVPSSAMRTALSRTTARHRAQRHHREPRRTARRAEDARLQVHVGNRTPR
jgi:glutamine phosphoribosylpyrophosphate amidotransferase